MHGPDLNRRQSKWTSEEDQFGGGNDLLPPGSKLQAEAKTDLH